MTISAIIMTISENYDHFGKLTMTISANYDHFGT